MPILLESVEVDGHGSERGGIRPCGNSGRAYCSWIVKQKPAAEWRQPSEKSKMAGTKKAANLKYVIVRTFSAGVFAGNLVSKKGREVVLANARRLWYWAGAASLSQLAVSGTTRPRDCKFPIEMPRVELLEAIEIIDVSPVAESSIKAVPIWQS